MRRNPRHKAVNEDAIRRSVRIETDFLPPGDDLHAVRSRKYAIAPSARNLERKRRDARRALNMWRDRVGDPRRCADYRALRWYRYWRIKKRILDEEMRRLVTIVQTGRHLRSVAAA